MQALPTESDRDPRRRALVWLGLALSGALLPSRTAQGVAAPTQRRPAERLPALVSDDVLRDYRLFLGDRDALTLDDFGGAHARRDVAEVLLLLKGLAQARFTQPVDMLPRPTDARLKADLRSGLGVCTATSYWRHDFDAEDKALIFSQPLVEDGEFEAGLYAMPNNHRALAARNLEDLRQLRLISNRDWRGDWETLTRLGLGERLEHVGNWSMMPRMLAAGRADLLLAPFQPSADMSLQVDGLTLLPVRGLKIAMPGTRHFVLSRRHPAGPALAVAMNAGLQALRRNGVIRRAYTQSGFYHPEVRDWTRL